MKPGAMRALWSDPFRVGLLAAGVFTAVNMVSQPAIGGDWTFDHSTTLKLSHVDRSGRDGYSGQVLQATPNLHLHGEGGRVKADINYNPTLSAGTSDTDPEALTHQLFGLAEVEAVEDRFFIGFDTSARLTGNDSSSASVDAVNFNTDNGEQVFTFGITPEFRHHLNQYADIVSRNRFDWVNYSGNDNGSEDSRSQTLNLQLVSGRHFSVFNWRLVANHRKTYFDSDRDDETRKDYRGILEYRINPRWSVNGSIGYEDNEVETDRDDTNGTIWDVGATWTPNPRTQASVEYGDRYFGDRYSGRISHRTRRTRFSADFSREVTNRRTQETVDSLFFLADPNGNPIVDPNTGNPIIVNVPQTRDADEDYLSTQFRGIVTITGRRTNVTITGRVSNRDYEISSDDEDTYGLSVRATRDLGSNFRASLVGSAEHVEGSSNNDNETYDIGFILSKRLSEKSSAALDLSYRDYNDDIPGEDYTEKRIGISFTTTYL